MGGVSTREASVTIVEKVAEIGDKSNSPLVTTSTNSVLTATVSVLLVILFLEDDGVRKQLFLLIERGGFGEGSVDILFSLYINPVSCFKYLLVFIVQWEEILLRFIIDIDDEHA